MKRTRASKIALYTFLLFGLALSLVAPRMPRVIESAYSQGIYRWLVKPYSLLTGLLPFSLAEVLIVGAVIYLVYKLVLGIKLLLSDRKALLQAAKQALPRLGVGLLLIYVSFNLIWGLNYSRLPFAEIVGTEVEPASVADLKELALHLTYRANELAPLVATNEHGVMILPKGMREMFRRADLGYEQAAELYPVLGGRFGTPKGVMLSRYWSYTGIGGMYFPFTAEANVNTHMPHFVIPFAATHEMAHQRGFAREDEANYIGYLTCVMHPDPDFQYSGVALALMHTMNALYLYDQDALTEVRSQFGEGLDADFREYDAYSERHDGVVQRVSTSLNDSYLKANRQEDGVQSYGRMIDLLMAEFKGR